MNKLPQVNVMGQALAPFEVSRIICIGRNYADHAIEMGRDPKQEPPFFFMKPLSALASGQGTWPLPAFSSRVDHELELVIGLNVPGLSGRHLSPTQAQQTVAALGLGLDMTCRDLQQEAKTNGRPWDLAKGFDHSAPVSLLLAAGWEAAEELGEMTLTLNQQLRQRGHWREMIWPVPTLLSQISQFVALQTGDLVFTGTPAGVGPVALGDVLEAQMQGLPGGVYLQVIAESEVLQRQ
jgi:fumarylpyruvate hydrolase